MDKRQSPTKARIIKLGVKTTAVIVRSFGRLEVREVLGATLRPPRKIGRLVFKPASLALMRRKPKPRKEPPAPAAHNHLE